MSRMLRPLAAGLVIVLASAPLALASGFHVYEQGAKASGQGVAFVARADDASAVWYNPAAMVNLDSDWFSVGMSAVFLGDTTFDSNMDLVSPLLFEGGAFDMEDNTATPVHAYYVKKMENWAFGAALTTPFGLVTEWAADFDGRFSARDSDLQTIVLNANAAYALGDGWGIALGVDYFMVDLKDFSRNISLVELMEFSEPLTNLVGDGSDVTWNAALHYRGEEWAFGINYRAGVEVDIDGDFEVSNVPSGNINAPESPLNGLPWSSQLASTTASGTLELPAAWAIGIAYLGVDRWEFEFDIHQINWSTFEEIPVDLEDETFLLTDFTVPEDWLDATTYRFGAAYQVAEQHELRFGAYTDETAVPRENLRPSIPDSDRTGYTAGYGYTSASGNFFLDFYWLHIQADDVSTDVEDLESTGAWGSYETTIDLVGLTANWRF